MKTENIYDAISGFDEKYVSAAENINAVRLSFRKDRSRKRKTIGMVCACAAVVIVSGVIVSQGWFGKKPPVSQNTFVPPESTSLSDDQAEGRTQKRQTTAGEQTAAAASNEEGSRISKTEKQTQTSATVNQNRRETGSNVPQTSHLVSTKIVEKPTDFSDEERGGAPPKPPVSTRIVERPTNTSGEGESGAPQTSRPFAPETVEKPTEPGSTPPERHGDYAAMIKLAGNVYIDTYEKYNGEADESSIQRSASYTDGYPQNDGEQNFNRRNVEYIIISSDTVICRINGEWIVFRRYA